MRDHEPELHQQAAKVVGQGDALVHQQLTRSLDRLHALLLDRLERCQFDVGPAGRFSHRQRIVLIGLVTLASQELGELAARQSAVT